MSLAEEGVRHRVRRLAALGEYQRAEQLEASHRLQREVALATAAQQFELAGANQWDALQRTKSHVLAQQRGAALEEEHMHLKHTLRARADRCQADEEELVRFAAAESAKLSTMPVPVPWPVLVLRQQETQQRLDGNYAAAVQYRRDATLMQGTLLNTTLTSRSKLLDQRITRQAATLLTREALAGERSNASMAALHARHAKQQRSAAAQLSRIEDGMLAAQRRAYRHVQRTRACHSAPGPGRLELERGTMLESRVYGDAYRLPSLCDLYGPMLDERASTLPAI